MLDAKQAGDSYRRVEVLTGERRRRAAARQKNSEGGRDV
jgi:hypothetical protein